MKKLISILMAVAMLVSSILCINVSAFAADTNYDEGSISLGDNTVKASVRDDNYDYTYHWYSFTPSVTQKLIFTSNCASDDLDPIIEIYDSKDENKTSLAYNDDSDSDFNFYLSYTLEANTTYYFVFKDYKNREANITFKAEVYDIVNVTITLADKYSLTEGADTYTRYTYDDNDNIVDKWYEYRFYNVINNEGNTITVTKIDGSSVTYTYSYKENASEDEPYYGFRDENGNLIPYDIDYWTPQEENHLQVGDNVECTVRVFETDAKFYIDIKPNPVASFEYIGNVVVTDDDIDKDSDYTWYSYSDAVYKDGAQVIVHYTDGTTDTFVYSSEDYDFKNSNGDYFKYGYLSTNGSNQSSESPWTPGGNNFVRLTYCGYEIEVPVTVISSAPAQVPTTQPAPTTVAPAPAPTTAAPVPTTAAPAPTTQPAPVTEPTTVAAPAPVVTTQPTTKAKEKVDKKQKKAKIKKVTGSKKAVALTWSKVKGIKGYQIQVSTDKKFKKNVKTKTVNKQKTTKATVKNLKSKKKYYVRIRTYKVSKGTKVYSSWSKAKTVKTK